MNRYNLFHNIHKGLRALLYDTNLLLQRTDFTIEEEAKEAVGRIQFALSLFDQYQQSEDKYVLPAMMDYEIGVAAAFEQEHEETFLLSQKIKHTIVDFKAVLLPLEKVTLSTRLTELFDEFTVFNMQHMGKEEQVVNKILWRYYTDAELKKIAWKIISNAKTSCEMPYGKWMLRGLNNNEIVRWLREVKLTAKEVEFQCLLKTAEAELHPQRWSLLQDVLTTGTFLAN